jgi:nucleoside-diphosphate-sugar epimerase
MNLKDKQVVVTGTAGVIGQQLLRRLVEAGANVWSVDLNPLPSGCQYSRVNHVQMDLAELRDETFLQLRPQVIFHLAACFERSTEQPDFWHDNYRNNLLASHRLVEAARSCSSVELFVFASSYLIYDPTLYLSNPPGLLKHLCESDFVSPRNLCGATKYFTEQELEFVHRTGGFRSISARIYRVYGRGSRDIISRWVRAALQGEGIEVYGPQNRFDYICADDVAEGLFRLGGCDGHGIVNLGSGQPRSIADVLDVLQQNGPGLQRRAVSINGPTESSVADVSRLARMVGWTPQTTLEEGIRKLVEYEAGHLLRKVETK